MPRQLVTLIIIFTLILLTVFGLTALQIHHQQAYSSSNVPSISQTRLLYQQTFEDFVTTYAVAEGKLFVIDKSGDLNCFAAQTGKSIWQINNVDEERCTLFVIQDGLLFVGVTPGNVLTVDARMGKLLPLQFQAIVDTSWGSKSPPTSFSVADGRIYVEQSGWRAYNVNTGALLWETFSPSRTNPPDMPYNDNVWVFEDNLVLASGSYLSGNTWYNGVYRINPDTGTVLWSISGFSNNQPLVYKDTVIFWNYDETNQNDGQTVISVDATTGDILWTINLKTIIYSPIIYKEQLLFVTHDGYFCALNLSDNSLVWKTPLKTPFTSSSISSGISSIHVDSQEQKIFWGYTTMEYNEITLDFQYDGILYNLDLIDGTIIWTSPFNFNSTFFSYLTCPTDIVVLNNTVFLNAGAGILSISKSTGILFGTTNFEHYILSITSAYDTLFVVVGPNVNAYTDYSNNAIASPNLLLTVYQQIIVIVIISLVIIVLLILAYRKYRNKYNTSETVQSIQFST